MRPDALPSGAGDYPALTGRAFKLLHNNGEDNMSNQLQRRHFEAIAAIIKRAVVPEITREQLAEMCANDLGGYNSSFDRERFITACLTGKMGKGRSHKNV